MRLVVEVAWGYWCDGTDERICSLGARPVSHWLLGPVLGDGTGSQSGRGELALSLSRTRGSLDSEAQLGLSRTLGSLDPRAVLHR